MSKNSVSSRYGSHADVAALNERVSRKLISQKEHPTLAGIFIYNYTPMAQFEAAWDDHILQARGLICRANGEIIARCIPKFFNHDEVGNLPWDTAFEVTTKLDGSMFILRVLPDGTQITATRGAFTSEQADAGRALLARLYSEVKFDPAITYIFELLHPLYRIVVDYGQRTELVLLSMIETATGRELPLGEAPSGLPVVERHLFQGISRAEDLLALEEPNAEGFVVRFTDGQRAKVKFAEYKRLHRLITGLSNLIIWEFLREGRDVGELLFSIPDEFNSWVQGWIEKLKNSYALIETDATFWSNTSICFSTRKEKAVYIVQNAGVNSGVAFKMLDGKPYQDAIWKMIEPAYEPPPFSSRRSSTIGEAAE